MCVLRKQIDNILYLLHKWGTKSGKWRHEKPRTCILGLRAKWRERRDREKVGGRRDGGEDETGDKAARMEIDDVV